MGITVDPLNSQEFEDKYQPRPNLKESTDGSYFNFEHSDICRQAKGGEWEIRPELGITANNVWTIIDCEDAGEMVSAGFHIVNKVGYAITEMPWTTGIEDAVWLDGREHYRDEIESMEDHASFCDSPNWVAPGEAPMPCNCGWDEFQQTTKGKK